MSDMLVELVRKYDAYDDPYLPCSINGTANANKTCTINLTVPRNMTPPIFVHYEIENFYQNHNRYRTSRDDAQLLGALTQSQLDGENCYPLNRLGNVTLNPCGFIANTLFNDVIKLKHDKIQMREYGIAWQSDLDYMYRQPEGFRSEPCDGCDNMTCSCDGPEWSCDEPFFDGKTCHRYFYPNDENTQYLHETYPMVVSPLEGVTNEHFIVWMRIAAFPKFRKLYGWINEPIAAGTVLSFEVTANWEVLSFHGSKSLIVSESNIFGGKSYFLGRLFFIIGAVCLVLALLFGLKHKLRPRKIADTKYLRFKED